LKVTNPSDRNIYLHLELPALIDGKKNQVMADQWAEGEFDAGMIYAGATIKTNALFSVAKIGDRPSGGRVVLTCHERQEIPLTYHLAARLKGEACYFVTYCYTRESEEYRDMIKFRDEVLSQTWYGRRMVKWYYQVSPGLVASAANQQWLDTLIRRLTTIAIWLFRKTNKIEDPV
jgi:hypothetical protein